MDTNGIVYIALVASLGTLCTAFPVASRKDDNDGLTNLIDELRKIKQASNSLQTVNVLAEPTFSVFRKTRPSAYEDAQSFSLSSSGSILPPLLEIIRKEDNSVGSIVEKRQGAWDFDYGLGGGRFGKRGSAEYSLGGGRFGRDVDHVDLEDAEM
ncbi:hypothetical protein ACJMK2_013742 [Sinanodonta woodiana]|uniref:Cholecystokinin n=1 Tax=Sinanodonta woodiana TaxID=1069815 RepID=A0ABD3V0F3_SINWO